MLDSLDRPIKELVLRYWEDLATPVSLKSAILLRYGEYDQLASCKLDLRHYFDAERYWRDASAISIIRKLRELPTTIDRKAVAEETFLACELECLRTNRRLFPYLSPGLWADENRDVSAFIRRARKIISGILGPMPFDYEGRHGPGATYGDKGRLTTVPDKMTSVPTITSSAKFHLLPWHQTLWAQACNTLGRQVSIVDGNRFTTVPKDCSKDRGIAIEPSINIFYQLGLGRTIRSRLKSSGIDLEHGQDIHRRVACEASKRGHLCTMDLSNASDTISRNLVRLLLPSPWFEALDDLRSKKTLFRGGWRVLEKFSSMGNGFTFELETLLFLGMILACETETVKLVPGVNVFTYGDDIICPVEIAKDVISVLKFFGMTVNERKTFVDGPFRESCGGDFFEGVDVRPFFLKELPNEPQQLISFANGIRLSSEKTATRKAYGRRTWFRIIDALPVPLRNLRGPKDLGDLLLHDEEERWQFRWRSNGIRYFRVYRPAKYRKVAWSHFKPEVILASATYGVESGTDGGRLPHHLGGVTPRDAVSGYKVGWVPRS
jgi:hypothetical protein